MAGSRTEGSQILHCRRATIAQSEQEVVGQDGRRRFRDPAGEKVALAPYERLR